MADEPKIELINDKWQNILPQYESNRFDLAIVDPPYGLPKDAMHDRGKLKNRIFNNGDLDRWDKKPTEDYFNELFRVSKNQIVWGGNYFDLPPTRGIISWDKKQPFENFSAFEYAWSSFSKPAKMFRLATTRTGENKIHPTQKPVALYRWILSKYAKPGDTILDTHLGSGSSAIAAWQKKHDFVGIECDTDYFDDMLHRFKMNTNRKYALEEWQKQSEQNGQQTIFSQ